MVIITASLSRCLLPALQCNGKQSRTEASSWTAISFDVFCFVFFFILFSSYVNVQEIKLVMEIIKLIKDKRRDVTFRNIGIITHYKAQKMMIQKDLDKEFDRKGWGIYIFTDISSFSVELKRRKGIKGNLTLGNGLRLWCSSRRRLEASRSCWVGNAHTPGPTDQP